MGNISFNLQVEPTDICNFKCIMCDQHKEGGTHPYYKKGFLDIHLAKKIVDDFIAFEFNHKCLDLQWMGEPLFHPHFEELLNYIKERSASKGFDIETITFVTNGVPLNQRIISALLEIKGAFKWIEVSLNSASPETFSKVTKVSKDNYWKIIGNVKALLIEVKGRKDFLVNLRFVVMQENASESDDFITYWSDFCKQKGLSHEVTNQHNRVTDAPVNISLWPLLGSPEKTIKARRIYEDLVEKYGLIK